VGRGSPYCENTWRKYWCLTFFFRFSIHTLVAKILPDQVVRWCRDNDFSATLCPVFSASRVQYISDLHSKLALRRMCGSIDIQSATAEIRRGKKEERRKKQDKNIMPVSATQGRHNYWYLVWVAFCYCTDVAQRRSTKLHDVWPRLLGWCTIYTFLGALASNGILPGAKFTLRPSLAFSYTGSVTARHASSGRRPNFAACYLIHATGRPSRSTLGWRTV